MTTINPKNTNIEAPPELKVDPVKWIQKNLFSTWYNGLLTVILCGILFQTIKGFLVWATTIAQWRVLQANLALFFVGRYPQDDYWRIWAILAIAVLLSGLSWGVLARKSRKLFGGKILIAVGVASGALMLVPVPIIYRLLLLLMVGVLVGTAWGGQQVGKKIPGLGRWLSLAWFGAFFIVLWLMAGGLGLKEVSTSNWGGLILTVFMAVTSIVLSFPIGVLLALGRQSTLPVVRGFSVLYIEFVRAVPLISILFMGQIMIPLFLPEGMRPDRVLRAIVGLTMFSSAYLAENVRAGLQSVPRGQTEAAKALGLNTPLVLGLIVLPQALKAVIPAIVGQFIGLFQDTTLLALVGLVELLGIGNAVLANPKFLGRYAEVYLFVGVLYWCFCYAMSVASRRLEKQLNTGDR
ncbi:MAG: amino acid ABC transporter permease [Hormoscilla sp. GM102CHS1]|nr:amino acid ABC transporter permease [Hormoscilla sp. GM102CHS1]